MTSFDTIVDTLTKQIMDAAPNLVNQVTIDPTLVKPSPGKVSAWIMPPEIAYPGWSGQEPDVTVTIMLIAGTPTTTLTGLDLILQTLDRLHECDLNMRDAKPAGFDLAGAGTLSAYQLTLNTI